MLKSRLFFRVFHANVKAVVKNSRNCGVEEWRKIPVLQIIDSLWYPLTFLSFVAECHYLHAMLGCAREPRRFIGNSFSIGRLTIHECHAECVRNVFSYILC